MKLDAGEIGWVRFGIWAGSKEYSYDVSDLTDALGDLLRATLQIVCGGYVAECVFDLEPGQCRLRMERSNPALADILGITVAEALDGTSEGGPSREVFSATCSLGEIGDAVLAVATDVVDQTGPEAFEARWGRPFPVRALTALRAAMSIASNP